MYCCHMRLTNRNLPEGSRSAMPIGTASKNSAAARTRSLSLLPFFMRLPRATLSLQDGGHSHAAGGADRDEPAPAAALGELLRQRGDDPRAGGGERMADGDARAPGVNFCPVDLA